MANNKLSILKFSETAYDIDALYLGGVAADKFARRDTNNSFTGKNTFSAGAQISGRFLGAGDDEGLVIGKADNSYAGVCLGDPSGVRSVFYLKPDGSALWRYNNGTSSFDIYHPSKAGTIALTSDIPTKVSKLENDSGYGTVAKVDNISPTSGNVSLSAVRFVSQTLTDAQKTQARTNIGAASSTHTHPTFFGYSQSESNVNTKICTIENFSLSKGVRVLINFSHTNTAANPYLNISSTGSKPIKYLDSSAAAGSLLQAGRWFEFLYDGSSYQILGYLPEGVIGNSFDMDLFVERKENDEWIRYEEGDPQTSPIYVKSTDGKQNFYDQIYGCNYAGNSARYVLEIVTKGVGDLYVISEYGIDTLEEVDSMNVGDNMNWYKYELIFENQQNSVIFTVAYVSDIAESIARVNFTLRDSSWAWVD